MDEGLQAAQAEQAPPTPLSRKWVRYLLGFGVGVAIGLAPYLGVLKVPLFSPLLNLIPVNIQGTVIPLSAALMGIVAVVIQWYAGEQISRAWLRKLFRRALFTALFAFVALMVVHTFVVVTVPILGAEDTVSFVVGFERPIKSPCTAEFSDVECIQRHLTLNPAVVESFWGDRQVRVAKLLLMSSYLLLTSCFGLMIGLLIIQELLKTQQAHSNPA